MKHLPSHHLVSLILSAQMTGSTVPSVSSARETSGDSWQLSPCLSSSRLSLSDGDMLATKWPLRKNGELILLPVMKLGQGDNGLVTIHLRAAITGIILDTGDGLCTCRSNSSGVFVIDWARCGLNYYWCAVCVLLSC